MRNRLSVLQFRLEVVALQNDRFEKAKLAFKKFEGIMEHMFRLEKFVTQDSITLGDGLVAFVASTPLLNQVMHNDSKVVSAMEQLDPSGLIREFTRRLTHVYTEDNRVDVFENEIGV